MTVAEALHHIRSKLVDLRVNGLRKARERNTT